MQTRIAAILSDYDGTLCPTDSVKNKVGTIPEELEQILWDISRQIPVCIISSKDYHFLHSKTKFASILSCIMGIETISLKIHKKESEEVDVEKLEVVTTITSKRDAPMFHIILRNPISFLTVTRHYRSIQFYCPD
jgi:trehalose-6-phosphatase